MDRAAGCPCRSPVAFAGVVHGGAGGVGQLPGARGGRPHARTGRHAPRHQAFQHPGTARGAKKPQEAQATTGASDGRLIHRAFLRSAPSFMRTGLQLCTCPVINELPGAPQDLWRSRVRLWARPRGGGQAAVRLAGQRWRRGGEATKHQGSYGSPHEPPSR